jgi:hypothetical protein
MLPKIGDYIVEDRATAHDYKRDTRNVRSTEALLLREMETKQCAVTDLSDSLTSGLITNPSMSIFLKLACVIPQRLTSGCLSWCLLESVGGF